MGRDNLGGRAEHDRFSQRRPQNTSPAAVSDKAAITVKPVKGRGSSCSKGAVYSSRAGAISFMEDRSEQLVKDMRKFKEAQKKQKGTEEPVCPSESEEDSADSDEEPAKPVLAPDPSLWYDDSCSSSYPSVAANGLCYTSGGNPYSALMSTKLGAGKKSSKGKPRRKIPR